MVPYDLSQIARVLNVKGQGKRRINGFRVDSRHVNSGDLFFAIKGQSVDGHAFLADIAQKGAAAAVVDRAYSGPDYGLSLLKVVDVTEALQSLARHRMGRHLAKVVAITGSIGKTTTKEFLLTLLNQKYRVSASRGNHNSQIGLPLTILNDLTGQEEVIVLEMGMTKPGHISQLLSIAPPDVALITHVALVHACIYDSLEHIARTKAEIFSHPRTRVGILHRDIPNFEELQTIGTCRKLSFSCLRPDADYYLDQEWVTMNGARHFLGALDVPGKHHKQNLLGAAAVAHHLGVDWEVMTAAVPKLRLPERRMQLVEKGGILFINDSYNACEDSVKAALSHLVPPKMHGRRVAVLGTMPELGGFSEACHQSVGEYALAYADAMFCLGTECQPIIDVWTAKAKPAQLFTDRRELISALEGYLRPGDVALLKGANTKKMWEILDEISLTG